jgi:hypothetical protein
MCSKNEIKVKCDFVFETRDWILRDANYPFKNKIKVKCDFVFETYIFYDDLVSIENQNDFETHLLRR